MRGEGFTIEVRDAEVTRALVLLAARGRNLRPALKEIGEHMLNSTEENFAAEGRPEKWAPLSPRTKQRKKGTKILTERQRLRRSIHYAAGSRSLTWGTNVKYAAIHQLGGEVERYARSTTAYFKVNAKTGQSRFAKKGKANFSQRVTIGQHTTQLPARPFLVVQDADRVEILSILTDHLEGGL